MATGQLSVCKLVRANIISIGTERSRDEESIAKLDKHALCQLINRQADGSRTALHMAALNGLAKSVQLLLYLGDSVSEVTEDGTTVDLIENADEE